ncbi:MAG: hypothetical protein ACXVJT_09635 [Thermoanaerobaculia bacterium]
MLKLQKLAVAAAISLMAVSAMASNFRAADQIYVPNAGHIQGSSGLFISDVFIANLSNDSVTISVIFSGLLGGTSQQKNYNDKFTLAANERKEFVDFFANTLGETSAFGQLIFNACKSGQDCVATQDPITGDSPNFRPISVETRIYAIPTGTTLAQNPPTVGQLFAGIPWYNFATSDAPDGYNKIFITGIRNTGSGAGTYRTNIGLANASQFSNTTIVVKLFAGNVPATPLATYQENFGPLGFHQQSLSAMFPAVAAAPTATNLFVTVEQTNSTPTPDAPDGCKPPNSNGGCPAFLAYGSVLDNVTSDPTTLEPQFTGQLTTLQIACIFNPSVANCSPKTGFKTIRHAVKPRG